MLKRKMVATLQVALAVVTILGTAAFATPSAVAPTSPADEWCYTCLTGGTCPAGYHRDWKEFDISDIWTGDQHDIFNCWDGNCSSNHTLCGNVPHGDDFALLAEDEDQLLERVAAQPEFFAADTSRNLAHVISCTGRIERSVVVSSKTAREVMRLTLPAEKATK